MNLEKQTIEIQTAHIDTMQKMTIDEYETYIASTLIHCDSRGIIRSLQDGHPLACNKEQLEKLIEFLQGLTMYVES